MKNNQYVYHCGECNQESKPIKEASDYIRLPTGHIWICSKCTKDDEFERIQKLLNGYIGFRLQF